MNAPVKIKRGRGRPKTDNSIPIYDLLGPDGIPLSKREQLEQIYNGWFNCNRCELGSVRQAEGKEDIVFGDGNANADIVVIGEAPGEEEMQTYIPFTGNSGKLLNKIIGQTCGDPELRAMSEDLARKNGANTKALNLYNEAVERWRQEHMFIINAVACRPPDNATPSLSALKACWERVWNTILVIDPVFIFAVGKVPMFTLLKKQIEITRVRGDIFDVTHDSHFGKVTYPAMAVLHPSYLLRKADWKVPNGDWEKTREDWRKGFETIRFLREQHGITR